MVDYEIRELWATADKDGSYLHILDKDECEELVESDKHGYNVKVIQGYGVFEKGEGYMPDDADDFHYTYESALGELQSYILSK